MTDMERSVSGFEVAGDWGDVVEYGERITAALQAAGCAGEAFDEWNDWRPRTDEQLDTDIREKPAEHVHLEAGPGEEADQSASDDLRNAGDELSDGDPDAVYKRMVTQVSALYFDNGLISAEINGTDSGYRFEVEIINDELKNTVEETISQQPDHWHIEPHTEIDTIEASEDIDLPDTSKSPDSEVSDTTPSEDGEPEGSDGS